jgi:hypothetical protein
MDIDIIRLIVIIVIAGLCWFANSKLNPVPVLKTVVDVIIVVVAVLLVLQSLGIMGSSIHVRI